MLLKFIGTDGSMGLKHVKVYDVKVYDGGVWLWVRWSTPFGCKECPYSSPATFAANWEA